MADDWTLVGTAIVSGLGLLLVAGYTWARKTGMSWPARGLIEPEARSACHRRRGLGAALIAVISVAFFFGANFFDPHPRPVLFLVYWALVLLLLLWLLALAAVDIWQTHRQRRRHQQRLAAAARHATESAAAGQRGAG
jgi:hypothetical protein